MELSSTRIIAAPRERVWQALNDPETLKASVPGCESLERIEADTYRATVAAKVGPVAAKFAGKLQLLDVDPPNGYRLKFEGQGGGAGFANGEARVALLFGGDVNEQAYELRGQQIAYVDPKVARSSR